MKKMLILVVALLTIPAMAAPTVTITCSVNGGARTVTVGYSSSDANLVRGFGLDLNVADGNNITAVSNLDPNYRIYPGQIVIVDGNVIDYNTPYPGPKVLVPSATVPIEMGSLYTTDVNYAGDPNLGYNKKPKKTGTLLKFTVSGTRSSNGTVTVNAARGGIVMENPDEDPNVTIPLCTWQITPPVDCLKQAVVPVAEWNAWVAWSKPNCWCYRRQCRGDTNGTAAFGVWVSVADFNLLKSAYNKADSTLAGVPNGICADLNHAPAFGIRVSVADLNILKSHYNRAVSRVPCCDADKNCTLDGDKYNFWTN